MRIKIGILLFIICDSIIGGGNSESQAMDSPPSLIESISLPSVAKVSDVNEIKPPIGLTDLFSVVNCDNTGLINLFSTLIRNDIEHLLTILETPKEYTDHRILNHDSAKKLLNDYLELFNYGKMSGNQIIISYMEKILIALLSKNNGAMRIWPFISQFYISQGYDTHKILEFFETRPDIQASDQIKILADLIVLPGQRELHTTYLLGLISKKTFQPHEVCQVLNLLDFAHLTASDWLSITDVIFSESSDSGDIQVQQKRDLRIQVKALKTYYECARLKDRLENGIQPTQRTFEARREYEGLKGRLAYPKACSEARIILSKADIKLDVAMAILEHLTLFPNETQLRNVFLNKCASYVNRTDTTLSMDQLFAIKQQAENMGNLSIATRLTDRASHLLISPTLQQYLPMISIVASAGPSGDGMNPETFDYHKGKQFPHLSLIVPELLKRGLRVEVLNWENPDIDWKIRKFLFALGLWGWSGKWLELDSWLERIKSYGITLINSMDFIQWNNRKTYLKDLQEANIPVIPTLIIPSDSKDTLEEVFAAAERQFKTRDIIFKGIVGAGGVEYHHCDPRYPEAAWAILEEFKKNNCGVVVQPFWKEVYEKGELSIVLFGNFFSHTYLKLCAPNKELVQVFHGGQSFHISKEDLSLKSTEFFEKLRAFRPDLKLTLEELTSAHGNIFKLIISLKKFFHEQSVLMPPVCRLDFVIKDGQLYIMEIEGIPYPEIGLAISHDPTKKVVQWSADEIIRQLSIHMAMMRYKLP